MIFVVQSAFTFTGLTGTMADHIAIVGIALVRIAIVRDSLKSQKMGQLRSSSMFLDSQTVTMHGGRAKKVADKSRAVRRQRNMDAGTTK